MSERDPELRARALDELRRTAEDPAQARAYMLKSSMISGLRRAAEIA
jgi:3-(3-hydroxy-phenyl)propionate hydroxylase